MIGEQRQHVYLFTTGDETTLENFCNFRIAHNFLIGDGIYFCKKGT